MKCFFDGSSQDHSWLTLAGFVGLDSFWEEFSQGWGPEVLQKRFPHAPYLHMRKLDSKHGEFARFSEERRNALVSDALDYLQRLPKSAYCAIVCTIDVQAHRLLSAEGFRMTDSHIICAECCIGLAYQWRYENHLGSPEAFDIFFDQNEPFMHDFRQRWLSERKTQQRIISNLFWGLIGDVKAVDMKVTPALQAADMLAWGISRRHSGRRRPMLLLSDVIEKILPNRRLTLDDRVLREKAVERSARSDG
jgi:hypothetical protein